MKTQNTKQQREKTIEIMDGIMKEVIRTTRYRDQHILLLSSIATGIKYLVEVSQKKDSTKEKKR